MSEDQSNFGQIAAALERLATVGEKFLAAMYPEPKSKRPAEITRPGDEKKEQFSDKPTSDWLDETERTVTRFQKRLDEGSQSGTQAPGSSSKTA